MWFQRRFEHSACYENVLGTSLQLKLVCSERGAGPRGEAAALAEIDRLAAIFNAYDPQSELSRWQNSPGETTVSAELARLLANAQNWMALTGNAFHPGVELLTRRWEQHSKRGIGVPLDTLVQAVQAISPPLWRVDTENRTAEKLRDTPLTLNSIAKGYIVDRASAAASEVGGVQQVLVNVGGDLCHRGLDPVRVAIANPFSGAENDEPLAVLKICNQAVATSGSYHRGFRVRDQWYSHVLDPRTGCPVEHSVSVSVLTTDCETADVLATAYSVFPPADSLRHADALGNAGVFLMTSSGQCTANSFWNDHVA